MQQTNSGHLPRIRRKCLHNFALQPQNCCPERLFSVYIIFSTATVWHCKTLASLHNSRTVCQGKGVTPRGRTVYIILSSSIGSLRASCGRVTMMYKCLPQRHSFDGLRLFIGCFGAPFLPAINAKGRGAPLPYQIFCYIRIKLLKKPKYPVRRGDPHNPGPDSRQRRRCGQSPDFCTRPGPG